MTSGTVLDSIYGRCRDTGSSVHESFLIICCGGSSAAMSLVEGEIFPVIGALRFLFAGGY